MEIFLTVKDKHEITYARSNANGVAIINAKKSRRILALEVNKYSMTLSRCLSSKGSRGIFRSDFKKNLMSIQSSAIYFSVFVDRDCVRT